MDGGVDEIYAVESYLLGKKVYYDKLESKDKRGHTIRSDHVRMRGIPTLVLNINQSKKK